MVKIDCQQGDLVQLLLRSVGVVAGFRTDIWPKLLQSCSTSLTCTSTCQSCRNNKCLTLRSIVFFVGIILQFVTSVIFDGIEHLSDVAGTGDELYSFVW